MPLVNGASHIKWHLPHSIHGEHRGRTSKSPIANHRVEYNYNKLIPVRIAIDKNNSLSECLVEFEVIQEFPPVHGGPSVAGSRDEKITLGRLTLNLAEYVEESESILRDNHGFRMRGPSGLGGGSGAQATQHQQQQQQQAAHARKQSTTSETTSSPKSTRKSLDVRKSTDQAQQNQAPTSAQPEDLVEEGIIRRYLLTDAKINSTLKISLLVVQIDGERTFTAPPLKTAAVFGGIGGMAGSSSSTHPAAEDFGQHFQDAHPEQDSANLNAQFTTSNAAGSGRDLYEGQDMYRRALAASWACQPGELPPDECIEDIFQGGDGFGPDGGGGGGAHGSGGGSGDVTPRGPSRKGMRREDSGSSSTGEANDFLRPADALKGSAGGASSGSGGRRYHMRQGSGESVNTLRNDGRPGSAGGSSVKTVESSGHHNRSMHRREGSKDSSPRGGIGRGMRRDSLVSLNGSGLESERSRSGFKSAREVTEREIRDDFVAWKLPETV